MGRRKKNNKLFKIAREVAKVRRDKNKLKRIRKAAAKKA